MQKIYVDSPAGLSALCDQIQGKPWLALDTEFMRETTYYPKLCLLQIFDGEIAACVDPLVLDDLSPLLDILYNPATTKVFHAARQDLEIFLHRWQRLPTPLFDTQPAAALLGQGDQVGYGPLVEQVLGIKLEKGHSRTDWSQRPLDPQQIAYAYEDVIYLGQLYLRMRQQLLDKGRLDWLTDDFAHLSEPATYCTAPAEAWKRVKGLQVLRGVQYAVLQALAAWRETEAESSDRPRRRLLQDELLIDMARRMPRQLGELGKIRGMRDKDLERWGKTWLELIDQARQTPRELWPEPKIRQRLEPQDEAKVDLLFAGLRLIAEAEGLSPAAVATRKDLEALVRGDEDAILLSGWQGRVVGKKLCALLEGKAQIGISQGQISLRD
ncbi:MAG: ribonuclease D [Gammaproteobacteria bacterium]|nr:ribonuclease D [Gammaproteobacteria bacterium]